MGTMRVGLNRDRKLSPIEVNHPQYLKYAPH